MIYPHFDFKAFSQRRSMRIDLDGEMCVWHARILRGLAVRPLWACELKLGEAVTRIDAIHGEDIADLLPFNRQSHPAVNNGRIEVFSDSLYSIFINPAYGGHVWMVSNLDRKSVV